MIKKPELPAEQVPKVLVYQDVVRRIAVFEENHSDVFEVHRELIIEHNAALEDAEKEVRARGVSCGPFKIHTTPETIDGEKLYELLGPQKFVRLGGITKEERKHLMDKADFAAAVAKGEISEEVRKQVYTKGLTYKKPHLR